ncbi:O-antigen ligase family protein [Qipengyuania sp. DY56-A-20]|uniref:O-antigen ligase family protein n=1 Tax=Qipengyuania benthica TaxID=3067651 RepID=A0ABT9HB84_9SPHN|nr:O-antigen ligase family protein [Qipengyuania sp. DY56-A-20]MDP4540587.1 O-antigen ligase family protein [Qipengyuania sp. DY56-A-20]
MNAPSFKFMRLVSPEKLLLIFIGIVFALGGASRADVWSLIILRPLAVVLLIYALVSLPAQSWRENRGILLLAAAWVGLVALHLIPLPPQIWESFPGRELVVRIDTAVGTSGLWRPLSLVPHRTINALLSLSVPLAALLIALSLSPKKLNLTIYACMIAAFVSAIFGLLQVIGGPNNIFYLYDVTNSGSAVGLFSNRNHNAMLLALALPLVAASASLFPTTKEFARARQWLSVGIGILLLPFLLVTQSRAGIVLGLVGIAAAVWVYRTPEGAQQRRKRDIKVYTRWSGAILAIAGIALATLMMTGGNALERLMRTGSSDDELRLQIWGPIARLAMDFLPYGSGIGSFEEVYRIGEPTELLQPQYINHAHNDFLEILLTGGVPAVALLTLAAIVFLRRGFGLLKAERSDTAIVRRRLGLSVIAILMIASLYDYPLRTPSLAVVFALAVAWFAGSARQSFRQPSPERRVAQA